MARLQILRLPEGAADERPPFLLVVDEVTEDEANQLTGSGDAFDGMVKKVGASAAVAFHGMTVTIPANESVPLAELTAQGDSQTAELIAAHEQTRLALCDAFLLSLDSTWAQIIDTARHRQRSLAGLLRDREITDPKLVALVRETLGVGLVLDRPQCDEVLREACIEVQKSEAARAHLRRERDELHAEIGLAPGQLHGAALSAVRGKHATIRELTERAERAETERDALKAAPAQFFLGEEPYTIEGAIPTPAQWIWKWNRATPARRLQVAEAAIRAQAAEQNCVFGDHAADIEELQVARLALHNLRQLHRPVEHNGQTICAECSGYGGDSTDNAPIAHPCDTIRAVTGEQA